MEIKFVFFKKGFYLINFKVMSSNCQVKNLSHSLFVNFSNLDSKFWIFSFKDSLVSFSSASPAGSKSGSTYFVDELGFLFLGQVITIFVAFLLMIPIVLPIILSKSYIVFESCDEEVTVRDWVKHSEACSSSDSISVWSKLSAFKEETTGFRVFFNNLLG